MELSTAINLINTNKIKAGTAQQWADLGSGAGLFTTALSSLLSPGSTIVAVDTNASALKKVKVHPDAVLETIVADFVHDDLRFKSLDGILMANSFHFVKEKSNFLTRLKSYLKTEAPLLIIEYNSSTPNPWVPYPLQVDEWRKLFKTAGYNQFEEIARHPSAYGRAEIVGMLFKN